MSDSVFQGSQKVQFLYLYTLLLVSRDNNG